MNLGLHLLHLLRHHSRRRLRCPLRRQTGQSYSPQRGRGRGRTCGCGCEQPAASTSTSTSTTPTDSRTDLPADSAITTLTSHPTASPKPPRLTLEEQLDAERDLIERIEIAAGIPAEKEPR